MEKSIYIYRAEVPMPSEANARAAIIRSEATAEATALVAMGAKPDSFSLMVRRDGDPKMEMVSAISDERIEFIPAFKKESLTVSEITHRMRDTKWLEANPHHPIAATVKAIKLFKESASEITTSPVAVCFEYRGKQVRLLRGAEDRDKQRRLLMAIGMPEEEALAVLEKINL